MYLLCSTRVGVWCLVWCVGLRCVWACAVLFGWVCADGVVRCGVVCVLDFVLLCCIVLCYAMLGYDMFMFCVYACLCYVNV